MNLETVFKVFVALMLSVTGLSADAAHCPWQAYSPGFVKDVVRYQLAEREMSVIAANRLGIKQDSSLILRKGGAVGSFQFDQDIRKGESRLVLSDTRGNDLLTLIETVAPCATATGRCTTITLDSELDSQGDVPAFELRLTPEGNFFNRYGHAQNPVIWRGEFIETIHWAAATLSQEKAVLSKEFQGPRGALLLSLAADPYVAPYFPLVQAYGVNGVLVFSGVVPSNFVYGRIIDRAHDAGFFSIKMDVTIDTGLKGPDVLLPPYLNCFGRI